MVTSSPPIDWQALAAALGTIRDVSPDGQMELGSGALGRQALEQIVGAERFADTVEHYVSGRPGFELARSVLWLVRPWSATVRCRAIFDGDPSLDRRRKAVELLRVVADRRVLGWIDDFLADPDEEIQMWGIGVLDQLVFSELVADEDCAGLLERANRHANPRVRAAADEIQARLAPPPLRTVTP
jgi:hypothetical protein